MERQKVVDLLNSSENECSKFQTKKWSVIGAETEVGYSHENPIKFLTVSIESSLCDYSDAYVLVTGNIYFSMLKGLMVIQKLHLKTVHHLENAQQKQKTHIEKQNLINIALVQFDWIQ